MLLVVSAGLIATWLTKGAWHDASGWVEAFATVAALGTAVVGAALVVRTVQIELGREGARLDGERRSQAVLVAAWPVPSGAVVTQAALVEAVEQGAGIYGVGIHLRNASSVPVTRVWVTVIVVIKMTTKARTAARRVGPMVVLGHAQRAVLPPNPKPDQLVVALDRPILFSGLGHDRADLAKVIVNIEFQDAAGIFWSRDEKGLIDVSRHIEMHGGEDPTFDDVPDPPEQD